VFRHNTVIASVNRNTVYNTYEDRSVVREVKGPNYAFSGKGGSKLQLAWRSGGEPRASSRPDAGASLACARGA